MKGYKATDASGKCRGYQFSLPTKKDDGTWTPGAWHVFEGKVKMCESGFHFCVHPSGTYAFYNGNDSRRLEIEAEEVIKTSDEPGANNKKVCKKIRFLKELFATGYYNTGNYNTGDYNTGNYHTGFFGTREEAPIYFFDKIAKISREEIDYSLCKKLFSDLQKDKPFDYSKYLSLPNATIRRLKALHKRHIALRKDR